MTAQAHKPNGTRTKDAQDTDTTPPAGAIKAPTGCIVAAGAISERDTTPALEGENNTAYDMAGTD
jgi:hypothetical protein